MLNVKYIIAEAENGQPYPYTNEDANGNAWFVKEKNFIESNNKAIQALDSLDNKQVAIYTKNTEGFFKQSPNKNYRYTIDSIAGIDISVKEYKPNYIKYESKNANDGYAVFSEMYYGNGWQAYIDGESKAHDKVNYTLRGMNVPKGNHIIKVSKKVLIVTYYWPPAGGPGVQRWLKFVKYLPENGVEPIVYCPQNPNYPLLDETLIKEVNSNITEKLMLYVRGNFFIPDARKNWVKPSVKYLSKYVKENGVDTIITTGPPHSLHLIGLQLKQKLDVKWLADFRDPWTTIGYHKQLKLTKGSKAKHKNLEKTVLNTADVITVTSNNTKKEFEAITNQPITVITNGYDVEKVSVKD